MEIRHINQEFWNFIPGPGNGLVVEAGSGEGLVFAYAVPLDGLDFSSPQPMYAPDGYGGASTYMTTAVFTHLPAGDYSVWYAVYDV